MYHTVFDLNGKVFWALLHKDTHELSQKTWNTVYSVQLKYHITQLLTTYCLGLVWGKEITSTK
jgi:hypothetical protein